MKIIAFLKKIKIDAVIIQDLGVYYLFKKLAPEIELHASTQMAVHNIEGAKFLQSLGFRRVVLARELNLNEIKAIAKATPGLDLEVFVHGALCYSYSGQCLFSALEYGKSANRGRCVYPCRAEYEIENYPNHGEVLKSHLFSMKDLALEEQILEIPALSLKIEGRKKTPLYVAAVTNYYRHILDGKKGLQKEAEDIKQIFARPWCTFHFNGKDKNVTDRQFVGHRGLLVGYIDKIAKMKEATVLSFKTTRPIARHDGLQIDIDGYEKPFGFSVKQLYKGRQSVFEVNAGETATVEVPQIHPHFEAGAPVYLASASLVKSRYGYDKPRAGQFRYTRKAEVTVEIGQTQIAAMSGQYAVSVKGEFGPAKDATKIEEAVKKAFSKTGGTGVEVVSVEIVNPQLLFAPLSMLNELRRQLVDILMSEDDTPCLKLPTIKALEKNFETQEKALPIKLLDLHAKAEDYTADEMAKTWFRLPQICRQMVKLKEIIGQFYEKGARHFVVENYYGFEVLKGLAKVHIATGSFLYVMNRYAAAMLAEMGAEWGTLALESSPDNMKKVVQNSPLKMVQVVKCYPALFTSAVCIRNNDCAHCKKQEKKWHLKQGGREYVAISRDCQLQLFNVIKYQREKIDGVFAVITDTSM